MFNEYYDILIEPSEADAIIEEMKDKFHDLIKNEAKSIMKDYREASSQLDNLKKEISRKKRRAEQLEQSIKELQEKHEQADKYDMPKKYIDKFVRDVTGYFAPGDKVFIINCSSKWEQCDKCQGKREIPATIDGKEHMVRCIECKGDGRKQIITKEVKETTIQDVHLKLCFETNRVAVWTSDCVYVRGREYAVDPKNIYRSREEAENTI